MVAVGRVERHRVDSRLGDVVHCPQVYVHRCLGGVPVHVERVGPEGVPLVRLAAHLFDRVLAVGKRAEGVVGRGLRAVLARSEPDTGALDDVLRVDVVLVNEGVVRVRRLLAAAPFRRRGQHAVPVGDGDMGLAGGDVGDEERDEPELFSVDGSLLLEMHVVAHHLVAPQQRSAVHVRGHHDAVAADFERAGLAVGEQIALVGRRLGDGVGAVGQRVGRGLRGVGLGLGVPRRLDDGDDAARGVVGPADHDAMIGHVGDGELDPLERGSEVSVVGQVRVVGAAEGLAFPEFEVVFLHLDAPADDLVEDAVGLHELVELPVLADLDHVAHYPLARVALGRFRFDDLVGAVGQRAHAGAGGPGVEGGVVFGREDRDDPVGGDHLAVLQLPVPVPIVPDGGVGAVVKRELGAFERSVALGVVPERAVLVLIALGVALADDEASALHELAELAFGRHLDDRVARLGHLGGHLDAVDLPVEQVSVGGGHLPDFHLPEGQVVEHDGAAGGRPFDGLRLAAPLERGLVDRPVEGGVALGCGRAGLGVDLLQHYSRGDGRLFRREGVVVVGGDLVHLRVEGISGGGAHFLGVERVPCRAQAL